STVLYTLSLHDALTICIHLEGGFQDNLIPPDGQKAVYFAFILLSVDIQRALYAHGLCPLSGPIDVPDETPFEGRPGESVAFHVLDRKSTRLNSSHVKKS